VRVLGLLEELKAEDSARRHTVAHNLVSQHQFDNEEPFLEHLKARLSMSSTYNPLKIMLMSKETISLGVEENRQA
jgi:hypothetical protein